MKNCTNCNYFTSCVLFKNVDLRPPASCIHCEKWEEVQESRKEKQISFNVQEALAVNK